MVIMVIMVIMPIMPIVVMVVSVVSVVSVVPVPVPPDNRPGPVRLGRLMTHEQGQRPGNWERRKQPHQSTSGAGGGEGLGQGIKVPGVHERSSSAGDLSGGAPRPLSSIPTIPPVCAGG